MQVNTQFQHGCLGVVLAGGLSSRMGTNKAALKRNAQTMLDFSQQQLAQTTVDDVIVSGKQYGLADTFQNIGPLGGICSAIAKYRPKSLLIMPVDLPFIDTKCLEKLKTIGEISQKACYYKDHFLPLYIPVSAYLETFIEQNIHQQLQQAQGDEPSSKKGPSMKRLLASVPSLAIESDNPKQLFNTNTQHEWQQAKTQFST